jgi:hypothetical protein
VRQREAVLVRAPPRIPFSASPSSRGRPGEYGLPAAARSRRPPSPLVGAPETAHKTEERASRPVDGLRWFVGTARASGKPSDPPSILAQFFLNPHIFSCVARLV